SITLRLSKELADWKLETRKYVSPVERRIRIEQARIAGAGENADRSRLRVDVPDKADTRTEVFTQLAFHLLLCVTRTQHFNSQVGRQIGDWGSRHAAIREPVPREKRQVGNPDEAGCQSERPVGAGCDPEVVLVDERGEERSEQKGESRFREPHGFLHEHAIDQFA